MTPRLDKEGFDLWNLGGPADVATPSPAVPPADQEKTVSPPRRATLVFTRIWFDRESVQRSITVRNLGETITDPGIYAVAHEYRDSTGTFRLRLARFGERTRISPGAVFTFKNAIGCDDDRCLFLPEGAGGVWEIPLDLQIAKGSLALFTTVASAKDFSTAKLVDYVQYGDAANYTYLQAAISAGAWDGADRLAPPPGQPDRAIAVRVPGVVGASNWFQE